MDFKQYKYTLSLLSMMFFVFLFSLPPTQAEALDYEDYSEEHSYPNKILEEHTTVYSKDGQYNKEEVQKSIDILEKLPSHTFEIIEAKGIHLHFIDFPLPDLKGMEDLDEEEEVPGYPEGSTYRDDVFGVYYPKEKWPVVRMDIRRYPDGVNSSAATTLHELGHALSFGEMFNDYFSNPEFTEIYIQEKPLLFPDDTYFDDKMEYFAEVYTYYFLDEETKKELKEKAPRTFEYMDNFINYSLYISGNTVEEVTLKWTDIEDAASYDVIRDGVLIDNVTDTTYIDQDYDEYIHEYEVKAIDQDGEKVFEFLREVIETKLLDRQGIELAEEREEESKEFEERMENKTTLEDLLEKYNVSTDLLPIIFWAILIFVFLLLPVTIVVFIVIYIRRKKKGPSK